MANSELKLDKELVLTVHGSEHEDILLTISEILHRFKGKFISSNFTRIGLQFTGLMQISINHMYLKPFISCLDGLTSYSVRFETQVLTVEQGQRFKEQMRFEIEAWGSEGSVFKLKFLQWLSRHRLIIESMQDSVKVASDTSVQTHFAIVVSTEFVVDENEIQEDLYQLGKNTGMTVLMLNQDISEDEELDSYQEVI